VEWGTITFSVLLVGLSLVLLAIHWNTWRKSDHGGLAQREQKFYRQQFRRRIMSSGMLGVTGLVMLGSLWIEQAWALAMLWIGVMLALLWVVLMALLDWWSSSVHYGRDEVLNTVELEILKSEIRKYQEDQQRQSEQ